MTRKSKAILCDVAGVAVELAATLGATISEFGFAKEVRSPVVLCGASLVICAMMALIILMRFAKGRIKFPRPSVWSIGAVGWVCCLAINQLVGSFEIIFAAMAVSGLVGAMLFRVADNLRKPAEEKKEAD